MGSNSCSARTRIVIPEVVVMQVGFPVPVLSWKAQIEFECRTAGAKLTVIQFTKTVAGSYSSFDTIISSSIFPGTSR
jgi:hypothetical protein